MSTSREFANVSHLVTEASSFLQQQTQQTRATEVLALDFSDDAPFIDIACIAYEEGVPIGESLRARIAGIEDGSRHAMELKTLGDDYVKLSNADKRDRVIGSLLYGLIEIVESPTGSNTDDINNWNRDVLVAEIVASELFDLGELDTITGFMDNLLEDKVIPLDVMMFEEPNDRLRFYRDLKDEVARQQANAQARDKAIIKPLQQTTDVMRLYFGDHDDMPQFAYIAHQIVQLKFQLDNKFHASQDTEIINRQIAYLAAELLKKGYNMWGITQETELAYRDRCNEAFAMAIKAYMKLILPVDDTF